MQIISLEKQCMIQFHGFEGQGTKAHLYCTGVP